MAPSEDHRLAADIATEAGELLVRLRAELAARDVDARVLKDEGDRQAHELLMARLAEHRPDDAILSEEGKDDHARLDAARVWIIDPLDGTREFSEPPRVDWAVHVALVSGGSPIAGAVALPAEATVLTTDPAPAAVDSPIPDRPRIIASRTRPGPAAAVLKQELGGEVLPLGSAGAKAMAVVRGQADIYAHTGGQYEWDSCAPVAVAKAAGLHASRIDGTELEYNNANPYLPDLLICRPELADACLRALGFL